MTRRTKPLQELVRWLTGPSLGMVGFDLGFLFGVVLVEALVRL